MSMVARWQRQFLAKASSAGSMGEVFGAPTPLARSPLWSPGQRGTLGEITELVRADLPP
ncbi:hypothetical protein [Streptomyces sp. NPDC037389]|uniref:hypothetical protein n=1 Tax=Streptomyces sp. NPDC037389 TaxID=3155369 RepID=UPI003411894C